MPKFITLEFLEKIKVKGGLVDGLKYLANINEVEKSQIARMPKLSSWECVLEEVLDTDHEVDEWAKFANELLCRGYNEDAIHEMRLVAWESAGWLNFEMMLWEWCHLDVDDMIRGINNRKGEGEVTQERFDEIMQLIEYYKNPPPVSG